MREAGGAVGTVIDETLTTLPRPCLRIAGATARAQSHAPLTFTASTRSHSSSGISSNGFLTIVL